jgi:hypothetical protein
MRALDERTDILSGRPRPGTAPAPRRPRPRTPSDPQADPQLDAERLGALRSYVERLRQTRSETRKTPSSIFFPCTRQERLLAGGRASSSNDVGHFHTSQVGDHRLKLSSDSRP